MNFEKHDPLNSPTLDEAIPRWGNGLSCAFGRGLMRSLGWRFEGSVPNLPKMVLIGAPHTSNWDFPLAMMALFALRVRLYWLGKQAFVNSPLKPLLLWLGGIPVDRQADNGVVGQTAVQFQQHDQFLLGLAPEGTRSLVHSWKMGFFYIARAADVPIIPVALDYGRKVINIGAPIWTDAGETAVMAQLKSFYSGVEAKHPTLFSLDSIHGDEQAIINE